METVAAIAIATAGVLLISLKPGQGSKWLEAGPVLTGLLAAGLFGLSAIGFRGGVTALETGGFLIRATTTLVLSLCIQTAILLAWMLAFDRPALRETGIIATRQLAKRQLTWLRAMPDRVVVDCLAQDASGQLLAAVQQRRGE